MDGLARASGAPVPFSFRGETYLLAGLTLNDFGVMEQHLLAQKPNPVKIVAEAYKDLPQSVADALIKQAYADAKEVCMISQSTIFSWLQTFAGKSFSFWLSLRHNHPTMTEPQALHLFSSMSDAERDDVVAKVAQASGIDFRGNLSGQELMDLVQRTVQAANQMNPSPGANSTAISPSNTTGTKNESAA